MAMLTGMLAPTSGLVMADGFDVTRNAHKVRQSLGICPQHDILWPVLTVQEHLWLYAALRGYQRADGASAATAAAEHVGLLDKLHCPADELSGGQRRSLSVAISFLGNPRVVVCARAARLQNVEPLQSILCGHVWGNHLSGVVSFLVLSSPKPGRSMWVCKATTLGFIKLFF